MSQDESEDDENSQLEPYSEEEHEKPKEQRKLTKIKSPKNYFSVKKFRKIICKKSQLRKNINFFNFGRMNQVSSVFEFL